MRKIIFKYKIILIANMSDIAFIVGSDAVLPPLLEQELVRREIQLYSLPYHIQFGSEHYLDGIDLTPSEFYQKMQESREMPTTSQPNPQEFMDVYMKAMHNRVKHVIVLPLLRNYSGTYDSACQAADELPSLDVRVIDTQTVAAGIGYLIMAGLEADSVDGTVELINDARQRIHIGVVVDNPKYVASRVSSTAAYVIEKMGIRVKLALKVENGEIKPFGVRRTMSQALELVYGQMQSVNKTMLAYILHADDNKLAEIMAINLAKRINLGENKFMKGILINDLTPAIGRYVGPKGAGIVAYEMQ
jgi:DegV family protein with EDD domain